MQSLKTFQKMLLFEHTDEFTTPAANRIRNKLMGSLKFAPSRNSNSTPVAY